MQRTLLFEAQSAARRVVEMVEGIVDANRAEIGSPIEAELRRMELGTLFSTIQETAVPLLREKQQTLVIQLERETPALCGDPIRLEQALRHLLENAHRFSPPGTRIEIMASADAEMTGFVRIGVVDAGSGINPEEVIERFDPFAPLGSLGPGRARVRVGLALGQAVAHALGGEIAAAPRPAGGTEISLRVPAWGSRAARIAQAQSLLTSSEDVSRAAWLHRACGASELKALGSQRPWRVLSPGEFLILNEDPVPGITLLGRVSDLREPGALTDVLQPKMRLTVLGGSAPNPRAVETEQTGAA
jgi:hypothetical protein